MATELAVDRPIREAGFIEQADILEALGGLPKDSEHCALLASNTLKAAIRDYLSRSMSQSRSYARLGGLRATAPRPTAHPKSGKTTSRKSSSRSDRHLLDECVRSA